MNTNRILPRPGNIASVGHVPYLKVTLLQIYTYNIKVHSQNIFTKKPSNTSHFQAQV